MLIASPNSPNGDCDMHDMHVSTQNLLRGQVVKHCVVIALRRWLVTSFITESGEPLSKFPEQNHLARKC